MKPLSLIAAALLFAVPAFAGDHDHGNHGNGGYGNDGNGWNDRDHDRDRWSDRNQRDRNLVVLDKDRTSWRLSKVNRNISDAIAMAQGNPALVAMLKSLRMDVDDLRDDVSSAPSVYDMMPGPQYQGPPPVVVQQPPPVIVQHPMTPVVYPMSEPQFRGLIAAIDRENFGNAKVRVVQQAAPMNNFVCAQVLEVLGRFSFANDKLAAVAAMKPRILDMQNSHLLFSAFDFDSDKAKLQQILAQ